MQQFIMDDGKNKICIEQEMVLMKTARPYEQSGLIMLYLLIAYSGRMVQAS